MAIRFLIILLLLSGCLIEKKFVVIQKIDDGCEGCTMAEYHVVSPKDNEMRIIKLPKTYKENDVIFLKSKPEKEK